MEPHPRTFNSLAALISFAMGGAERNFKSFGQVLPVVFIVGGDGQFSIAAIAIHNDRDKQAAPHVARQLLREAEAIMYAYVCEAWVTDRTMPPGASAAEIMQLAEQPRQPNREAVLVIGATAAGEQLEGGFDILRDATGKGTLARRGIKSGDVNVGVWANLFKPAVTPAELERDIQRVLDRVRRV